MGFFGISLSLVTLFCLFGVLFIWDWANMPSAVRVMAIIACFIPGINMLMAIAFAGTLVLRRLD